MGMPIGEYIQSSSRYIRISKYKFKLSKHKHLGMKWKNLKEKKNCDKNNLLKCRVLINWQLLSLST